MPHPRTDPRFIVALALAFAPAALGAASGAAGGVTVDGPAGARLRIEALDPHVVRIWLKPSGDF